MSKAIEEKNMAEVEVDVDTKSIARSLDEEQQLADIRSKFTYEQQSKLLRKIDLHLLPLLMLAYLIKNMDVNAISYVKTINVGTSTNILTQLNISANDYSWTATAFVIPFCLSEIPSTLFLKHQTPRLHFTRILLFWSIACACHAAAKNLAGLLVARAFLGFFEGGLYPAIVTQMTYWYRPDEMGWRMAILTVLSNFAGILCALLTYGMGYISGNGGVSGWQWTYIIQGLMGLALTLFVWLFHPDFPDTAKFLTEEERLFIQARLPPGSSRAKDEKINWAEIKDCLSDWSLYAFSSLFLVFNIAMTGYTFWLPTVISELGFKSGPKVQLLNIPPAALYVIVGIFAAWWADFYTRIPRAVHCLGANVILMGMFFGLAYSESPGVLYTCICFIGAFSAYYGTLVYPWRSQTLKGSTYAAFAFGFQNTVAQTVGAFSPQIFRSQYAPRYRTPYLICIGFFGLSLMSIAWTWYLTFDSEKETRMVARERRALGKQTGQILQTDVTIIGKGAGSRGIAV